MVSKMGKLRDKLAKSVSRPCGERYPKILCTLKLYGKGGKGLGAHVSGAKHCGQSLSANSSLSGKKRPPWDSAASLEFRVDMMVSLATLGVLQPLSFPFLCHQLLLILSQNLSQNLFLFPFNCYHL